MLPFPPVSIRTLFGNVFGWAKIPHHCIYMFYCNRFEKIPWRYNVRHSIIATTSAICFIVSQLSVPTIHSYTCAKKNSVGTPSTHISTVGFFFKSPWSNYCYILLYSSMKVCPISSIARIRFVFLRMFIRFYSFIRKESPKSTSRSLPACLLKLPLLQFKARSFSP